ncbi:ComF family protein [Arenibacter sp. GZD96]|uniref:ComF family protein n=1 Tax=Aurantibrevibacter litoralis TaxID=3106030 RepID=UPI002AFF6267|nr:phosphoribosyltransferase family protein [Arenibacter sp. GZD-96]MEA1785629.1 ComF family protein [Arenibacter sp. GZD-96]
MLTELSKILNDINNILVPTVCFGCNASLRKGERLLCTVCRNQLPLTDYNFTDENPVDRIFYGRIDIKKANSFLFFTPKGIAKTLIHYLKYKNQQEIGVFLGNWWGEILKEDSTLKEIDYVIPVPLHKHKLRKRGYNQVSAFGKRLAFHLKAHYADDILFKTANTRTQTKKSRLGRWQNHNALFSIVDATVLQHKRVLLIDDVLTTGATLESCARAIKKAEDVTIYIATMAVTI